MAIRTTEAVVLKTQAFRNASLIATVFTKDFGKVQGLAKGIKLRLSRKDSRHYCYLEPLTLIKIVYYQKDRSGLHLLTQSDLLDRFAPIRQDLKKMAAGSFILELADKGTALEDKNKAIFYLLLSSLNRICKEKGGVNQIVLFFQKEFLRLSGLMPKGQALGMPIVDFIKIHIDSEFKTLEFMEKMSCS